MMTEVSVPTRQLVLRRRSHSVPAPPPPNPVNVLLRAGAFQQDLDKKRQDLSARLAMMRHISPEVEKQVRSLIHQLLLDREISRECMKSLFQGDMLGNMERMAASQNAQRDLLLRIDAALNFEPHVAEIEKQCKGELFKTERAYSLDKGADSTLRLTQPAQQFLGTPVDGVLTFDLKVTQTIRLADIGEPSRWRALLVDVQAKLLKAEVEMSQDQRPAVKLMFELASSKVFSIDSFGYHGSGSDRSLQGHNCHVLSWTCDATQAEDRCSADSYLLTIRVPLVTDMVHPAAVTFYASIH